jgi:hypothetical protein
MGDLVSLPPDLFFPSEDHRRSLCAKVDEGGLKALDDIEKRQFHGYRYAWRRLRLGDFAQRYGVDPNGDWFDGFLVNKAIEFYGGAPSPAKRADPTPEDIAHVEAACAQIRANLAALDERNRTAFARPALDPRDLAALQAGLGIEATEEEAAAAQ